MNYRPICNQKENIDDEVLLQVFCTKEYLQFYSRKTLMKHELLEDFQCNARKNLKRDRSMSASTVLKNPHIIKKKYQAALANFGEFL